MGKIKVDSNETFESAKKRFEEARQRTNDAFFKVALASKVLFSYFLKMLLKLYSNLF
jgi:hypothetical protein